MLLVVTYEHMMVGTYGYDWKSRMNINHIPTATQWQAATGPQPLLHPLLRTQPQFAKRRMLYCTNNLP